jgi:GT2 family glycosyltransferase
MIDLMSKVYIVLVNHNNFNDTIECLESVLKSDYTDFQIFVIDNSSNTSSLMNLSDWAGNNNHVPAGTAFKHLVFPLENKPLNYVVVTAAQFNKANSLFEEKLTIIQTENRGFAAANNIALKYILNNGNKECLIWILNNDTVIEKNTLTKLVSHYKKNSNKKCVLGSKLRYYYPPDTIQAVAGHYNIWLGKHRHIGDGAKDLGQFDNYQFGKHDYIVGASIFLPQLFLDEIGLMCEDYFLYFEELDWIKTAMKKGFNLALVPDAIVYHKEGASIAGDKNVKNTAIAEYHSITNRVRFIKKWYPYNLITVMPGVFWALIKRTIQGKLGLVKKSSVGILKILFTHKKSAIK